MSEITLHTGCAGDVDVIYVDWFDQDNRSQKDKIEILIEPVDKPRTLTPRVNGRVVFSKNGEKGQVFA